MSSEPLRIAILVKKKQLLRSNSMLLAVKSRSYKVLHQPVRFKRNLFAIIYSTTLYCGFCLRNCTAFQAFELRIMMRENNLMLVCFQILCKTLTRRFQKFFSTYELHRLHTFLRKESTRKHIMSLLWIRKCWCIDCFQLFCLATAFVF